MDNRQTNTEAEYLKLAIDTIRLNAINEKVSAVRRSLENKPEKALVRSIYRTSLACSCYSAFYRWFCFRI